MSRQPCLLLLRQRIISHRCAVAILPLCRSRWLCHPLSPAAADGSGYEFLADSVLQVDKMNPQVKNTTPAVRWRGNCRGLVCIRHRA